MAVVQDDVLALEDIQQRLAEQLKANQEQAAQLQAELVDQNVKLSQVQVRAQTVRGEISQWQTMHSRNELEVKRARQDLEHAKGSSLEQSRLERVAAAEEAFKKSKHELAVLVTALEKDTQEEGRLTEQAQAITEKLHTLAGQRDELMAAQERLARELVEAIKETGEGAVADVRAERERRAAALAQAETYYDQAVAQFGLKLAAINERAALDFMAAHIRVDEDPPEVRQAQEALARAQEEVARPRVTFGDAAMQPTIVSLHTQVDVLHARIETLRNAHRERLAQALLAKLRQPAPALVVEASGEASPLVVEVAPVAAHAPAQESHELISGLHSFGLGTVGAVPKPASIFKEKS